MVDLVRRNRVWQVALVLMVMFTLYWGVLAARRYVSEAHVVISSVQGPGMTGTTLDLPGLIAGGSASKDILYVRDYLVSADALGKLDAKLDLRGHYSDSYDIFSRLLYRDIALEWFVSHYQKRVEITYDDAGILVIRAQAYTPKMAHAIAGMLVEEGERFMNDLGHKLAREQVAFAEKEVAAAGSRMAKARQALLAFQARHGLVSPTGTVEAVSAVTARLEGELTALQARRRALESYLAPGAPDLVQIGAELRAVEQQLAQERGRLVAPKAGAALNRIAEEFELLVLEATFQQDFYKAALGALERARVDATRLLKMVSVLQQPTHPEYSLEPGRLYNIVLYLLATLLLAGILHLLLAIIREHRD